MQKSELILIREAVKKDENYIYSTWIEGLLHGSDAYRDIDPTCQTNFKAHRQVIIKKILSRPSLKISVAVLREDPDTILGYCVFEDHEERAPVIHWIFVRTSWRGIGIARDLAPKNFRIISHLTKAARAIKMKKRLIYNPFLGETL